MQEEQFLLSYGQGVAPCMGRAMPHPFCVCPAIAPPQLLTYLIAVQSLQSQEESQEVHRLMQATLHY